MVLQTVPTYVKSRLWVLSLGRFENHHRAGGVGVVTGKRLGDAARHASESRQVHNGIGARESLIEGFVMENRALNEQPEVTEGNPQVLPPMRCQWLWLPQAKRRRTRLPQPRQQPRS